VFRVTTKLPNIPHRPEHCSIYITNLKGENLKAHIILLFCLPPFVCSFCLHLYLYLCLGLCFLYLYLYMHLYAVA
jgi:hypothetical protein